MTRGQWQAVAAVAGVAMLLIAGCSNDISPTAYEDFIRRQQPLASYRSATHPPGLAGTKDSAPATDAQAVPATSPARETPTTTQPAYVPIGPAEIELTDQSTLADYLAYAALHNPQLQSSFAEWQAAREQVPQARSLADPLATYRLFLMSDSGDTDKNVYEINQMFPWPGKLRLRGEVASREAQAARERFDGQRLRLNFTVQQVYAELYYLQREIGITQQNIDLLAQAEALARVRYATSAGGHPDVIRAQVEQGKLADRLRTLGKLQAPTVARLNAAMNRPPAAPIAGPTQLPRIEGELSDQQLLAIAGQANPELRAMDQEIAARGHDVALARKEYYPDVMLGVGAEDFRVEDDDEDMVMGMVTVNLPIWYDKLAAGVRQARWRRLGAVTRRQAMLNDVGTDVERSLFEFEDAGRKVGLYRDTLLPKAEQGLQASLAAYRTGGVDFQTYLDAQQTLLEFQLSLERSQADRVQRLAELEMLVGQPLLREDASP